MITFFDELARKAVKSVFKTEELFQEVIFSVSSEKINIHLNEDCLQNRSLKNEVIICSISELFDYGDACCKLCFAGFKSLEFENGFYLPFDLPLRVKAAFESFDSFFNSSFETTELKFDAIYKIHQDHSFPSALFERVVETNKCKIEVELLNVVSELKACSFVDEAFLEVAHRFAADLVVSNSLKSVLSSHNSDAFMSETISALSERLRSRPYFALTSPLGFNLLSQPGQFLYYVFMGSKSKVTYMPVTVFEACHVVKLHPRHPIPYHILVEPGVPDSVLENFSVFWKDNESFDSIEEAFEAASLI